MTEQRSPIEIEQLDIRSISGFSIPEVYLRLGTDKTGLTSEQVAERRAIFGPNVIPEVKGPPLWRKLASHLVQLMALLLWAGSIMAFVAGMPELGAAIIAVILINAAFSFWQEYKAERATQALRRLLPAHVRVIRGGHESSILAQDLVPGDVMLLAEGDNIPADGRLVAEFELRTNNATLTGESLPVRKTAEAVFRKDLAVTELPNIVFAGTSVASGNGTAVVIATGMHSQFGRIADLTQSVEEEPSPLQKELRRVTTIITLLAVGLGALFFALSVAVLRLNTLDSFLFAIGIIVANVPEGLLPTVTLSLALSVQRMAERHALIKRLSSVETLGCTTVICTDKTGTLTQNEMTVREIWLPEGQVVVTGTGYEPVGEFIFDGSSDSSVAGPSLQGLLRAAVLCSNARLLPPGSENLGWRVLGDPTEAALLVAATKAGLSIDEIRQKQPRVYELPFDSRRKRMSVVCRVESASRVGSSSGLAAYVKGAPKEILDLCTHVWIRGQRQPLSNDIHQAALVANDLLAQKGLRVLAVAERILDGRPLEGYSVENVERDLTLLGLVAMMDPPRPEVAEAVQRCFRAGIRVLMITGDYGLTAESIARRVGIVRSAHPRIITGAELDALSERELQTAIREETIFARVAPEHKMRIVSALKESGEIVAVTGDGVNDAPALKRADIGVAMGIAGTDVAKEAADMILTDDNFASIVNAIEEGRAVYANIRKFTTYILASNIPELVPFLAMVIFRIPLALTVMQILSVDLGTDVVPALGLSTELPEPGIMDRPPRSMKEHLLNPSLLMRAYGFLGIIEALASMAAFYFVLHRGGGWTWRTLPQLNALITQARAVLAQGGTLTGQMAQDYRLYLTATTACLAGIIATQVANVFACRTERESVFRIGLFTNRLVLIGIVVELALIIAIVYLPPLQVVFGTAPLNAATWLFIFAWTPVLFTAEEIRKWIFRRIKFARAKS